MGHPVHLYRPEVDKNSFSSYDPFFALEIAKCGSLLRHGIYSTKTRVMLSLKVLFKTMLRAELMYLKDVFTQDT